MVSASERLFGLVALLLASCGAPDGGRGPAPVPRSIDPSACFTGHSTAVQISGDNFLVRPDGDQLDTRHRAWLDDLELDDVTWINAHSLGATVPAGITSGSKTLTVENAFGRRGSLADAFSAVDLPPSLAATVSVDGSPDPVGVGQAFTLLVDVSNPGGASANVTFLAVTPAEAGCGAPTPATPQTVVGGGLAVGFTITCAAAAAGSLAPVVSVGGQDARTGAPLTTSVTLVPALTVQAPAVLTTAVGAAPTSMSPGQATSVTFYVTNGLRAAAATLTDVTPWLTGTGDATCSTVTVPKSTTLAAGATWSVGWTCTATGAGGLFLGATLGYTAGKLHLAASPAVPVAVTIAP